MKNVSRHQHDKNDPPLTVLVMLVSRNVFHVVSALQSIVFILFGGLIRSLADPTLAALYRMRSLAVSHSFTKVSMFWDALKVVLNSLNRFDIKNALFGILDADNISILVNLLESKYFIYRCKLNKGSLCIRLLVDKLKKKTYQTECSVSRKKKQKPLLSLIQQYLLSKLRFF